jgi:hypothetical protein
MNFLELGTIKATVPGLRRREGLTIDPTSDTNLVTALCEDLTQEFSKNIPNLTPPCPSDITGHLLNPPNTVHRSSGLPLNTDGIIRR